MAFKFGDQENLHCISDVTLTGENGEALCLGYKTTTHWILLGASVSDDGYVLKLKDVDDKYYPLPAPSDLSSYQSQGLLPATLPPYKIETSELVLGYSLWWALPIGFLWSWWRMRKDKKATPTPATAQGSGATGGEPPASA